jgi:arylsulfatase A-like enzyme
VTSLRLRTSLLAFATVLGAGCSSEPAVPANVVVVLVDTLRAQNLGLYGYARATSPELSAFAEEALVFEDATAQAPCTYPSANSILTGRDGTHFWIQPGRRMGIPEGTPSLAELLHGRGYATAAVSASPIVRETPSRFNPEGGFGRGFDIFDERCIWKDAACVNRFGLEYVSVLREPFFLYLHYMDPHDPFQPPEAKFSAGGYEGNKWFIGKGEVNPISDLVYGNREKRFEVTAEDRSYLIDLYDDEIAFFDARFGELMGALRARGVLDRSIVAVVADHGEEFLEHGHIKHCHTLFDTEIHTPMVVRLPGVEGGRRIATPVENLDLVPTVLDYLGTEEPELRLDGRSLRPLIEESEGGAEVVFAAWGAYRSAKAGRHKLIWNLDSGETELYDLETDPGETRNLAAENPREVRRLQGAISARVRELEGADDEGQAVRRGEAAAERLRALGYVQ